MSSSCACWSGCFSHRLLGPCSSVTGCGGRASPPWWFGRWSSGVGVFYAWVAFWRHRPLSSELPRFCVDGWFAGGQNDVRVVIHMFVPSRLILCALLSRKAGSASLLLSPGIRRYFQFSHHGAHSGNPTGSHWIPLDPTLEFSSQSSSTKVKSLPARANGDCPTE